MATQRIETRATGNWRGWMLVLMAWMVGSLVGCSGGGGDDPPLPDVPPVITAQPSSQSVTAGTGVTFSVVASGAGLSYQWQRSTDAGIAWADLAGAVAASYATGPASAAMNGHQFRVRIGSGTASVTSAAVTLSVSAVTPVSISVQPAPVSVAAGADATFTVTAGGTAPTYQWQDSRDGATWTPLSGATNPTLVLNALGAADNGRRLRVVVSNALGSVTSDPALLTVTTAAAGRAFVFASYRSSALISGLAVDSVTGALTDVPGSPLTVPAATASGFALTLHPNGRFLYAVQSTRTWVYAIDAATGSLTLTSGSPYTTVALIAPDAPKFSPTGSHVIYNRPFQPASYAVDATTGALTDTGSVTFSIGAASMEFSADGQYLFVQDGSSNLRVLRVAPLTLLTDAGTSLAIKTGSPFYARGGYLLAQPRGGGVASYTIGTTGTLTPVQSIAGLGPNLVAHPNGRCFFMSGEVGGTAPSQSINFTPLTLDLSSGAIAAGTAVRITVPGTLTRSSYPLQMSPTGSFGYLSTFDRTLFGPATPVALDGSACSLEPRTAFDPGPLQLALSLDPAGRFLFNHSASAASLFVSVVDPLTLVPAQVTGSPFSLPGLPMNVVVRSDTGAAGASLSWAARDGSAESGR